MSRDVVRTTWGTVHVSAVEHGAEQSNHLCKVKRENHHKCKFFFKVM